MYISKNYTLPLSVLNKFVVTFYSYPLFSTSKNLAKILLCMLGPMYTCIKLSWLVVASFVFMNCGLLNEKKYMACCNT